MLRSGVLLLGIDAQRIAMGFQHPTDGGHSPRGPLGLVARSTSASCGGPILAHSSDHPPFRARPSPARPTPSSGLFFSAETACTWGSYPVGPHLAEVRVQLAATPTDGLGIESGDLGHQTFATMALAQVGKGGFHCLADGTPPLSFSRGIPFGRRIDMDPIGGPKGCQCGVDRFRCPPATLRVLSVRIRAASARGV